MTTLKITGFSGEIPRTAERLLPVVAAQQAENINLTSGEIRPVRQVEEAFDPSIGVLKAAYRATYGAAEKWHAWTTDIDIVRGPFSYDVEPRFYWTGDGVPRYASFANFGVTDFALGLPAPTVKPSVSCAGGTGASINRTYLYTFYNPTTGEESAGSPVADIAAGHVSGTWTVNGFSAAPLNPTAAAYNVAGLVQRLYRTSGTSAKFQLVVQRLASSSPWIDAVSDAAMLGDEYISASWQPPPPNLRGLISLPNGSLCGFTDNTICFSEPYQPHAWPRSYRYGTDYAMVGIASFGTTVVACTTSYPYVTSGSDPQSVNLERIDNAWPCLSKRSVTSVGDGVVFATTHGIAFVGMTGASIFTKDLFTREEWEPLNPASMVCAFAEDRLHVVFKPAVGTTKMLIISPGESAYLTRSTLEPNELYKDPSNGLLYLVGPTVQKYNSKLGAPIPFNWLSKELELPTPVNFGAAKVEYKSNMTEDEVNDVAIAYAADLAANAVLISTNKTFGAYGDDAYNVRTINGSAIKPPTTTGDLLAITFYTERGEVFSKFVTSQEAFRLPSGFKHSFISIRLTGNVRIKSVRMAETMSGLANG